MFHGGLANFLVIDAAAVVFYLYIYVGAAMVGTHGNVTGIAFALFVALFVAFQAVGYRIAHQMNEGIRNLLDDVIIQFCLSAGQCELYLLVYGFGAIAQGT